MQDGSLLLDKDYIRDIHKQMLRFAQLQLHDVHSAEDVVQEAIASALASAPKFHGSSTLKTWVFAILKNKIADILREARWLVPARLTPLEDDEPVDLIDQFDSKGSWQPGQRPRPWGDPELSFEQHQFWSVFEACLNGLPPAQARIFMMREFIGLDTDESCNATGISSNNLFVLLHRARLNLRACLEKNWFATER